MNARLFRKRGGWLCRFDGCNERIPVSRFGCLVHWFELLRAEQARIRSAYRAYKDGKMGVAELHFVQGEVLANWRQRQGGAS